MCAGAQSTLALVDLAGGRVLRRLSGVGRHAHGAVLLRQRMLCLDSGRGALVSVDTGSGQTTTLWQVGEPATTVCPRALCICLKLPPVLLAAAVLGGHANGNTGTRCCRRRAARGRS